MTTDFEIRESLLTSHRRINPWLVAWIVGLLILIVGLSIPSVNPPRGPAKKTRSLNQLKQIGLAANDFYFNRKAYPAACSTDESGKPLLSWRVHLLPYLDANPLYLQFRLDEPWDSEHNRQLIEKMPDAFRHPKLDLEDGKTVYLAVVGEGSAIREMPTEHGTTPRGNVFIPDGESNTIAFVEVNEEFATVWTRPDDYRWEDQAKIVDGLAGNWMVSYWFSERTTYKDLWLTVTVDGAGRYLRVSDNRVLESLIRIDDGAPIDWDELD